MEKSMFLHGEHVDGGIAREASAACVARYDETLGMNALFALRDVAKGQVITPFRAKAVCAEPTYLTVQVADGVHIELWPEHVEYMNHSCDPNCMFDFDRFVIEAVKDIHAGDEITFFYPSTEWHMQQPFECGCGAAQCCGTIAGADVMSLEILARYRLTPFISQKLSRRTQ